MQYVLVAETTRVNLEGEVNELLSEGWQLHGSPVTYGGQLLQAMTLDLDMAVVPFKSKYIAESPPKANDDDNEPVTLDDIPF